MCLSVRYPFNILSFLLVGAAGAVIGQRVWCAESTSSSTRTPSFNDWSLWPNDPSRSLPDAWLPKSLMLVRNSDRGYGSPGRLSLLSACPCRSGEGIYRTRGVKRLRDEATHDMINAVSKFPLLTLCTKKDAKTIKEIVCFRTYKSLDSTPQIYPGGI